MSLAPSFFADAVAPARIFPKNGFVASFVIRPTWIVALFEDGFADADATTATVTATTSTRTAAARLSERRLDPPLSCWRILPASSSRLRARSVVPITRNRRRSQAHLVCQRLASAATCGTDTKEHASAQRHDPGRRAPLRRLADDGVARDQRERARQPRHPPASGGGDRRARLRPQPPRPR